MRISKKGFTLIEVMVAAAILGIGCLGVLGLMMTAIRHNNDSTMRTRATAYAEEVITQFETKNDTTGCTNSTWKDVPANLLPKALENVPTNTNPDKEIFKMQCIRYDTGGGTVHPTGVRVLWGKDGGKCAKGAADVDTFAKAKISNCEFVTLSYLNTNPLP
jgi:prepilin-type N-terminal cleavage/methylation domain-containing protein